jgi:hypothetical protein
VSDERLNNVFLALAMIEHDRVDVFEIAVDANGLVEVPMIARDRAKIPSPNLTVCQH